MSTPEEMVIALRDTVFTAADRTDLPEPLRPTVGLRTEDRRAYEGALAFLQAIREFPAANSYVATINQLIAEITKLGE